MILLLLLVSVIGNVQARCLCFMPKHLLEQKQQIVVVKETVEVPVTVVEHKETVVEHKETVKETIKEVQVEQPAPQIVTNTVTEKTTVIEKTQDPAPVQVPVPEVKPKKKKRSPASAISVWMPIAVGAVAVGAIGYFAGKGQQHIPQGQPVGTPPVLGRQLSIDDEVDPDIPPAPGEGEPALNREQLIAEYNRVVREKEAAERREANARAELNSQQGAAGSAAAAPQASHIELGQAKPKHRDNDNI